LLGEHAYGRTAERFPLLIKLLDCADWLSLQVHPNDEQAVALEGPGQFGKTEAWHILEADPNAEILCGFRPGSDAKAIEAAIRTGTILDYTQRLPMHTGETIFIRAGTVHALGPGLLVYEVQQTSDITYRVFDWNRPASAGRKIHIEQSLAVFDPNASGQPIPPPSFKDGARHTLVGCPYFTLELLTLSQTPIQIDPQGRSFHALTVIDGAVRIHGAGWEMPAARFDTILVPAAAGAYTIQPLSHCKLLKSAAL
jgi:mannose-6-phosphate isomerase